MIIIKRYVLYISFFVDKLPFVWYNKKEGEKAMKFVHIADMHFDSPFVNLSSKEMLGDIRRLDHISSKK